jgi:hypothetical protein
MDWYLPQQLTVSILSRKIEIGAATSDLSSRYHIAARNGSIESRAVIRNASTDALVG